MLKATLTCWHFSQALSTQHLKCTTLKLNPNVIREQFNCIQALLLFLWRRNSFLEGSSIKRLPNFRNPCCAYYWRYCNTACPVTFNNSDADGKSNVREILLLQPKSGFWIGCSSCYIPKRRPCEFPLLSILLISIYAASQLPWFHFGTNRVLEG